MNTVEMIFRAIDRATAPIRKIDRAVAGLKKTAKVAASVSLKAGKLVAKGLMVAGLGLTTLLGASTHAAIGFESAMADVNKVVDFKSPEQFKKFSTDILTLSTRIPMMAKDLAAISAEAGAAGIALEDNLRFTEFAAKSAVAFEMAAGAAGDSFAKIRNVFSLTQDGLEGVANAVNHLSNNMASKAPEIISFLQRAGGVAPMLKMSAVQMAALGSAMIATGTAPEIAGRAVTQLATSLKVGGKKVNAALKMIGMNHTDLMKQFDANPGDALIKLFSAIEKSSKGTEALKKLVGQGFVDDFSKIVNKTDLLAESFGHIADKAAYAGSVQAEFATRAATTANTIDLLKNNIQVIAIEVGSRMLPAINTGLTKFIAFLQEVRTGTSKIKTTFVAVSKFFTDFGSTISDWGGPIGETLGNIGTSFGKIADTVSRIIALFTGGEAQGLGTIIGDAVGATVDIILKGVELAATAISAVLVGLETVIKWFQSVDWSALIPDLPDMPDFSEWAKPVQEFFSFDWLPEWQWPEIALPTLPEIELPDNMFAGLGAILTLPFDQSYEAINYIWEKIKALFNWSPIAIIREKFGPIADTIAGFLGDAADTAGAAWNRLKGIFSEDDPITIAARDPASIERATKAADKLAASLGNVAKADTTAAIDGLNRVRSAAEGVPKILNRVVKISTTILARVNFSTQGQRMMDTLAAGIRSRAHVVTSAIKKVTQDLRDHLPSSPAKVGPLSDLHRLKFGETIAASIRAEPMVKAMRLATAATLAAAIIPASSTSGKAKAYSNSRLQSSASQSSGGGVTFNYNPTINLSGDAASAEKNFKQLLEQHKRDIKRMMDEEIRREARRKH